ncbi:MAG: SRPBCC family protein [Gaiella sp.]
MRAVAKVIVPAGLVAAGTIAVRATYRRALRTPVLTWGATAEEADRVLPGDELLEEADVVSTRAVTIAAPPSAVWPWLVQMGSGRGGAYTYDWIENLFGLGMRSAEAIHPEWQDLEVGDEIPGKASLPGMRVEVLEPERALVTRSSDGTWVWAFVLDDRDGTTRLLSRNRIAMRDPSLGDRLGMAVMEPGSLVMERKMLLGIKERAERLAAEREVVAA